MGDPGARRHRGGRPAGRERFGAPAVIQVVDGFGGGVAEQGGEAGQCAFPACLRCQVVERACVGEAQQDSGTVIARADIEGDEDGALVGECLARTSTRPPERFLVGGVGLAEVALRPVRRQRVIALGQGRVEGDRAAVRGGDRQHHRGRGVLAPSRLDGEPRPGARDPPHRGLGAYPLTEFGGDALRDLLGAVGEPVLLGAALDVEHPAQPAGSLDVAHRMQHRHVVGFAAPGHPRHDGHQVAGRRAGVHRAQPPLQALLVQSLRRRGVPGVGDRDQSAQPVETPLDAGHVEQLDQGQFRNGAAVGAHLAMPADQVLAATVGRHGGTAQFGGQCDHGVLGGADERRAQVDRHSRQRRGVGTASHPVAAFEHQHLVSPFGQLPRR